MRQMLYATTAVRKAFKACTLGIAVLALIACAGQTTNQSDSDLRLQAADHAFGGRFEYFIVHPAGAWTDQAAVGLADLFGRSTLAESLAARMAPATANPVRLLVTGANADKTLQVIIQAFDLIDEVTLPRLELLYLGVARHESTVRERAERAGARMRFAVFED